MGSKGPNISLIVMKYICIKRCIWTNLNGTISIYSEGDIVTCYNEKDLESMIQYGFIKLLNDGSHEETKDEIKMKSDFSNKMVDHSKILNKKIEPNEKGNQNIECVQSSSGCSEEVQPNSKPEQKQKRKRKEK